jgi:hypothetical protein
MKISKQSRRIRKNCWTLARAAFPAQNSQGNTSIRGTPHRCSGPHPATQSKNLVLGSARGKWNEPSPTKGRVQERERGSRGRDLERSVRTRKGLQATTPAKRESAGPSAMSAYPTPAATVILVSQRPRRPERSGWERRLDPCTVERGADQQTMWVLLSFYRFYYCEECFSNS